MAERPARRGALASGRLPACDGRGLLGAFETAAQDLSGHVEEINALNVFPVPDGDTGTNMLGTMRAAVDEARSLEKRQRTVHRVAAAIGFGSLMGARGNSGVILSQIFRGMSDGLDGRDWFDGRDLAHAFVRGSDAAYRSVGRPVEGTMLTVIREASGGAVAAAQRRPEVPVVMSASVQAAGDAVARTPELLPILREAGVVDAGGQGLFRILEGALRHMAGGRRGAPTVRARIDPRFAAAHEEDDYGYETVYVLSAGDRPLDPERIRRDLQRLGRSVLVAGGRELVKIHVHNERPDEVIGYGLSLGALTRVAIENLDVQAREVRATRAGPAAPATVRIGEPPERPAVAVEPEAETSGPGVVAVAAGDGLAAAFRSLGAAAIVRGGQSANPATGELVEALRSLAQPEVIVLPNNPNVRLAAEQAAQLLPERRVVVVPTRNAAEGIAALVAFDPSVDLAGNLERMRAAADGAQTLQVTRAVRDARVAGTRVAVGDAIALGPDEGIVAVAADERKAALAGAATFRPGFELLTVYRGADVAEGEAEALVEALRKAHPAAEVELVAGGQPHYSYLLAAE
ncbi:MAG TPA: DAK2 domain-containing protein [Candidatus Limnocylindrales bacterium]|nr:DAK2 domain-containing protein [Candidatus Limnocylindrales bacterium]